MTIVSVHLGHSLLKGTKSIGTQSSFIIFDTELTEVIDKLLESSRICFIRIAFVAGELENA